MTEPQQPMSVPLEGLVRATAEQRNQALDEVAALRAIVEEQRAELERLRAETPAVQGQVSGAGSPSSAPAVSPK